MLFKKVYNSLIFALLTLASISLHAQDSSDESFAKFAEYTEGSTLEMDFSIVDQLLHAGVLNMGPSKRTYAKRSEASLGTRLKQTIDGATENEANRFFYETLKKDQKKIRKLRKELEAIPSITPLKEYSREALLAYWLNLYQVTLINELALIYPTNDLRSALTGDDSILDRKLLMVDNTRLSLNDIHYSVLPALYPNDVLFIYGIHQGIKGSPNVRTKAYTAKNVRKSLINNAQEFVNSNRGTQFNSGKGVVRISTFYERNAELFNDFENEIQSHILQYANASIKKQIAEASSFEADIKNWRINDLYGSIKRRDYGVVVSSVRGTRLAVSEKLSVEQSAQLSSLMQVRAINFGGGTVTLTDLPTREPAKTDEAKTNETKTKKAEPAPSTEEK